jgi:UDP-glucose 4-epimerase
MGNRILVTGGCGFVGSPLVRSLVERGDHILVYDNLSRGTLNSLTSVADDVHFVQADVRDATSFRRALQEHLPDVVIHLAALHFIPDCDADPEHCLATNVLGTQVVLDCAREARSLRGFVYASTVAVYEPSMEPHSESSRLAPTDIYGSSKLAGEQLVTWFSTQSGVSVGIARLSNVYGPGETNPHLIPAVIEQAQRSEILTLGNLSTRRDYVFTDDVARALVSFADLTRQGRSALCNVGTGVARSGETVVATIAAAMSRQLTVEVDQERVRPSDRPVLCVDPSTASSVLGWEASTAFEDGIQAALRDPAQYGRRFGTNTP